MTVLRTSPSGRVFDLNAEAEEDGSQLSWAIDPLLGNDDASGTPAAPLRTMSEFNARLSGILVRVAMSLSLVGNVTDQPLLLAATRFASGASLTVSGTVTNTTNVGAGLITLVTTLQAGCTFQLTTSGVVWTAASVGTRLLLSGGHTCWVQEFIDANNVVVGPPTNATTILTPTAGLTFTLQSLSLALPPDLNIVSTAFTTTVSMQHLEFSAGAIQNVGGVLAFFGCRHNSSSNVWQANSAVNFRGCYWALTGSLTVNGGANMTLTAHTSVGGSILCDLRQFTPTTMSLSNTALSVRRNALCIISGIYHVRNTASPVQVFQGGRIVALNFAMSGSVGNTLIGIKVFPGAAFTYVSTKPSISGSGGNPDTVIGTTGVLYASIPFAEYLATSAPAYMTVEA